MRAAREAKAAAQGEAATLKAEKQIFFEQQMSNEVAKAAAEKQKKDQAENKEEQKRRKKESDPDDFKTDAQLAKEKAAYTGSGPKVKKKAGKVVIPEIIQRKTHFQINLQELRFLASMALSCLTPHLFQLILRLLQTTHARTISFCQ